MTTQFADLGIDQDLVDVLAERGITTPFEIQTLAIPDGIAGRQGLRELRAFEDLSQRSALGHHGALRTASARQELALCATLGPGEQAQRQEAHHAHTSDDREQV